MSDEIVRSIITLQFLPGGTKDEPKKSREAGTRHMERRNRGKRSKLTCAGEDPSG